MGVLFPVGVVRHVEGQGQMSGKFRNFQVLNDKKEAI